MANGIFFIPKCWPIPTLGEFSRSYLGIKEGDLAERRRHAFLFFQSSLEDIFPIFLKSEREKREREKDTL